MSRIVALLAVSALTVSALACGTDGTAPTEPQSPTTIAMQKIAGDAQTDTVTRMLSAPLIVEVTQVSATGGLAAPQPAPGVLVNFVPVAGGGSAWAGSAITDSIGRAADLWTLGSLAGKQRMEVRAVSSAGVPIVYDTFFAEALPDTPVALVVTTDNVDVAVDETKPISYTYLDQHGNLGALCHRTEPPSGMAQEQAELSGWQQGLALEFVVSGDPGVVLISHHDELLSRAWGATQVHGQKAGTVPVYVTSYCLPWGDGAAAPDWRDLVQDTLTVTVH